MELITGLYNSFIEQADPRVEKYAMMRGPERPLGMVGLYLLMVVLGPKLMAPFRPLELKRVMVIYNVAMAAIATYVFVLAMIVVIGDGFSFVCDEIDASLQRKYGKTMLFELGWWFTASKFLEFADTLFFILRKKEGHVSVLHVYHHASMATITWIGFKLVPGGQTLMYPLVNSFIHIVMYTYYLLAAMGPRMKKYLWWKRYLTIMQISQFFVLIFQTIANVMSNCEFPKVFASVAIFYTCTILLLFLNFYYKTYIKGRGSISNTTTTTTKKSE